MLQNFLDTDSDVLRVGLSNYLHQYQYSNARTDDLWRALSNVSVLKTILITLIKTFVLSGYSELVCQCDLRDGEVGSSKRLSIGERQSSTKQSFSHSETISSLLGLRISAYKSIEFGYHVDHFHDA